MEFASRLPRDEKVETHAPDERVSANQSIPPPSERLRAQLGVVFRLLCGIPYEGYRGARLLFQEPVEALRGPRIHGSASPVQSSAHNWPDAIALTPISAPERSKARFGWQKWFRAVAKRGPI